LYLVILNNLCKFEEILCDENWEKSENWFSHKQAPR